MAGSQDGRDPDCRLSIQPLGGTGDSKPFIPQPPAGLKCPHRIAGREGKGDECAVRIGKRSHGVFLPKKEGTWNVGESAPSPRVEPTTSSPESSCRPSIHGNEARRCRKSGEDQQIVSGNL
jgi:hypothetical protein